MAVTPPPDDAIHRMVDQLTDEQKQTLAAFLRSMVGDEIPPIPVAPREPVGQELPAEHFADEPVRELSFIGIGHGPTDLAARSQEILWRELGAGVDA